MIAITIASYKLSDVYNYQDDPFDGGINIMQDINSTTLKNQFDFGDKYKWTEAPTGSLVVTDMLHRTQVQPMIRRVA